MSQKLVQSQEQKLAQQQRLTQQQVLQVKLLEMPLAEFEQNVQLELDDNPALETTPPDDLAENNDYEQEASTADAEESFEMEERADALDNALKNMTQDDEMPVATSYQEISNYQGAEMEEQTFGDPTSFYDKLQDQMRELVLTEEQQDMMEYLIGSLDDDGLLRKDLQSISDELAVYYNID
ncbi:MAG: RNA polymerase sigma-54 factor, partial [Prevotella sp.]|nr:RNA polymerase sigma-54 factor [Prevotella sp.]